MDEGRGASEIQGTCQTDPLGGCPRIAIAAKARLIEPNFLLVRSESLLYSAAYRPEAELDGEHRPEGQQPEKGFRKTDVDLEPCPHLGRLMDR